jgi:hypothetical protein
MPYKVSFIKPVEIANREQYFNGCCIGGDIVLSQLLPAIRNTYERLQSEQEDWGWFAWFEKAGIKLAIDVHTSNESTGEFKIHLTSRKPRLFLGPKVQDTPELEGLRELVVSQLQSWGVDHLSVERVNEEFI